MSDTKPSELTRIVFLASPEDLSNLSAVAEQMSARKPFLSRTDAIREALSIAAWAGKASG